MSDLDSLSALQMAAAVRAGTIAARELTQATLDAIEAHDATLNAVVATDAEKALATADAIDSRAVSAPGALPPYAGVPILIKDLNNVAGMPTTFGTRSMADFVPPFDDETVVRILAAGFVVIGKTNVSEIGSLPWTESLLHGPARNPWDPGHTPGGSSGGAAAAVAAGYVPAAHASDGGGSIRIPASHCGIVGIKPGRGRVSHAPLFGEQVMGFATQGPLGRRVADAAALLDVMQGYATGDPYHLPPPGRPYVEEVGVDPGTLRIGMVTETPWATPDDDVQAALAVAVAELERLGHTVEPMRLRLPADLVEKFLTIWSASVAANPLPPEQLEPHNQAFAARGHATSAPALLQAHASLQMVSRAVATACGTVDAVLAPVLMGPPPRIGEHDGISFDELTDRLARHLGLTPVVNVTGQAAIALPVHISDRGLPIGVQLIGGPADEALLVRLGAQLEAASGWVKRRPPLLG
ncbi:amidase [soil metagenome]